MRQYELKSNRDRIRRFWCALCAIVSLTFCSASLYASDAYKFGVFPYLSAGLLEEIYAPMSRELTAITGVTVHFRTSSTFKRFFERLQAQQYDLMLVQPFWVPPAIDQYGYVPLVRMSEPFTSLIMVLDESPYKTLQDLKGQVIATPPAFVPVVHMARRALQAEDLQVGKDVTFQAFKSVDSCFQQIIIQKTAACVSPPFAPEVVESKLNRKMRVLFESPPLPNLALLAHRRMPVAQREKIRAALIQWHHKKQGQKLLGNIKTGRFVAAESRDYDVVREFMRDLKSQ